MTRLVRAFPADHLQVRAEQRIICGIAVPFDTPTLIREDGAEYRESVARGAFARTIAERGPERVKALIGHRHDALPIGRASVLREDAAGLYAELRISRTRDGDEALELVRDGALDGLSIGFLPVTQRYAGDLTIRTEIALREISVTAFPAFDGARITAVRAAAPPIRRDIARARQDAAHRTLKGLLHDHTR